MNLILGQVSLCNSVLINYRVEIKKKEGVLIKITTCGFNAG
jgi:hypothetical protein